jgi:hypothetical protein
VVEISDSAVCIFATTTASGYVKGLACGCAAINWTAAFRKREVDDTISSRTTRRDFGSVGHMRGDLGIIGLDDFGGVGLDLCGVRLHLSAVDLDTPCDLGSEN